jgi:rieske iron-sulfur protein
LRDQPGKRGIINRQNPERQVTAEAIPNGSACPCDVAVGRRALLGVSFSAGLLGVGPAAAQSEPARDRPKAGDLLIKLDSPNRSPLTSDDLHLGGGQVMAWPMDPTDNLVRDGSRLNKVLLIRLDPGTLEPQTRDRAADGVVAYSAICPHTACEVTSWYADRQILECPCHNSQYDPKAGARLISGPSQRGLAALPLRIADGKLAVARPFIGRLGIQQT